jgi:hypothetical protein
MHYTIRRYVTVVCFIGLPLIYGLTDNSLEAKATLAAALGIVGLVSLILIGAVVADGIGWVFNKTTKRGTG